ncbi:PREDICTED: uncharacterized protein At2g29880-like [Ipomoea nil]|uniref:uncharacterized protein At2g29880-like n=1 Tax=Ipomoea nil TaxID=35883 RepID=UPI000900FF01|nr:PREDICTED: uncharacterized protein At2g29880-like [Ipomoea nil]
MVQGKNTSGFDWNDQKHMVYAEDAIWESYLISQKEAAPFRTRSFRFYNELSAIYSKDRATGKDAQTADDVVEEIQDEEHNDIRADTEDNAFVGLDDIDLTSTQPEPQNDGRKRSNSSKRKRSHDEAIQCQWLKLERALKEVDGLDLVSFKLTDHPNKVAFFLSLDPDRRLQWIRRFLAIN